MKFFIVMLLLYGTVAVFAQDTKPLYSISKVPVKMSVTTKKKRFFYLLVPVVTKVYKELYKEYSSVEKMLQEEDLVQQSASVIEALKKRYGVQSDTELLKALKPHPISITLAQAAMESAWGTSRFFREANNIFGMWNNNKNTPRIAATKKRNAIHTVWLSRYQTLEDSVRAYYMTLSKGKSYKAFREVCYISDDVYKMVAQLDKYSERGEVYTQEISSIIRYNKLQKYDI